MKKAAGKLRVLFIHRRRWKALGCLMLAAAIFYAVNFPASVGAAATKRQLPIYCVQRDQKMVAISFDAAWGDVILRRGKEQLPAKRVAQKAPCVIIRITTGKGGLYRWRRSD